MLAMHLQPPESVSWSSNHNALVRLTPALSTLRSKMLRDTYAALRDAARPLQGQAHPYRVLREDLPLPVLRCPAGHSEIPVRTLLPFHGR